MAKLCALSTACLTALALAACGGRSLSQEDEGPFEVAGAAGEPGSMSGGSGGTSGSSGAGGGAGRDCGSLSFRPGPPAEILACPAYTADGLRCVEENTVCGPLQSGEICFCISDCSDGLVWDCDDPPPGWLR